MSYHLSTPLPCSDTERDIDICMQRWRARDWGYDYNVQTRRRDNRGLSVAERAVTLWWITNGGTNVRLTMDAQTRPRDNLRVLYLAAHSMRLNELRGVDPSVMRSAYLQLTSGEASPYTVLGVEPGAPQADVQAAWLAQAKARHPDAEGGSEEEMAELSKAMTAIRVLEGWT